MRVINGEATAIFGSQFAKDHNTPIDKDISLDQRKLEHKQHERCQSLFSVERCAK